MDEMNRKFENEHENFLTKENWEKWIFFTDLHEDYKNFNEAHLWGLLLARCKARFEPVNIRLGDVYENFVNSSKKTNELTLRQFRDAIEDLQSHWTEYFEHENVVIMVDALFTKFGSLNLCPQTNLDDVTNIDPLIPDRMSNEAIRRFTMIFCVFYRHILLDFRCEYLPDIPLNLEIEHYHRQAALDAFYEHAMFADLCPAARITYKQDFAGMYHSVPQVVYFHFPDYIRKRQVDLDEIRRGSKHLNCLSVVLEMKPDVSVKFEDDLFLLDTWCWILLSGGKVYLQSPSQKIYSANCIWTLLSEIK